MISLVHMKRVALFRIVNGIASQFSYDIRIP
jgi:hypothetical protein